MSASNQIPARAGGPGCGGSAGDGATVPHRVSGVSSLNSPGASAPGAFSPKRKRNRWEAVRGTDLVVWTKARDAELSIRYAAGELVEDIYPVLQAMPGLAISAPGALRDRAQALRVMRPAEFTRFKLDRARQIANNVGKETPERVAYAREAYTAGVDIEEMLAAMNAMEGPSFPHARAVRNFCKRRKFRRPERVAKAAEPKIPKAVKRHNSPTARAMRQIALTEPPARNQPSTLPAKRLLAADLIRKGGKDVSIFSVAGRTGLEPWQVANVIGCVRHGWAIV